MAYKLVIFDFDGTLTDSFPLFLDIGDRIADRYRFRRLDRSNLENLRGLDAREMLRRHEVPVWKLPLIARHARALMREAVARMPLFPGVGATLAHLADRGLTLAIVTSNARDSVLSVLGPANAAHVTHLECGVSLFGKAARLRKLLRKSGVTPAEALLVGDEIRDAVAARRAGIAFGAVAWGYTRAEALLAERPRELFRGVEDLRSLAEARRS
jgi:phosphoglycolate phosphatase